MDVDYCFEVDVYKLSSLHQSVDWSKRQVCSDTRSTLRRGTKLVWFEEIMLQNVWFRS